ncbi:hypothetical protein BGZ51_006189 [Haplosporangium sp. Z 767]|nr:hypothetical protein BGZ51_006189 [Haplosporangium sp. Z 767]KAF9180669.1 hypothetical protein BGZ50_006057 [Haplosporangium sp. Z 11]
MVVPCHSDQEGQGSAPFPSSSSFSSFSSSSYADTSITAPTTIANDTVNEAADSDNDEDENCMIPGSTSYTWPGILAATVSVPFVHLPLKSKPDLRVQIRLLHVDTDMTVKSFQAALWERAIFRVLRTTVNKKQGGNAAESLKEAGRAKKQWITAGVRERVISTQRTEKGWTVFSTSPAVAADRGARVIDRTVSFATPNPIRGPDELYSSRNCNASTYSRIPRSERYLHGEDASMTNSHPDNDPEVEYEYGAIEIEIQHFLRFSIAVTGTGTVSESKTGRGGGGAVERDLGDIPVVVCGVPGEPACDGTGLPTYMGSFSTSSPSLEETHRYEAAQTRDSMNLDLARLSIEGFAERDSAQHSMHSTSSIASHPGTLILLPEDYENDDAYMAVMGLRRTSIPPEYEVNTAWQSLDSSAGEMQQSGVYTDSSSSHSQDH